MEKESREKDTSRKRDIEARRSQRAARFIYSGISSLCNNNRYPIIIERAGRKKETAVIMPTSRRFARQRDERTKRNCPSLCESFIRAARIETFHSRDRLMIERRRAIAKSSKIYRVPAIVADLLLSAIVAIKKDCARSRPRVRF